MTKILRYFNPKLLKVLELPNKQYSIEDIINIININTNKSIFHKQIYYSDIGTMKSPDISYKRVIGNKIAAIIIPKNYEYKYKIFGCSERQLNRLLLNHSTTSYFEYNKKYENNCCCIIL